MDTHEERPVLYKLNPSAANSIIAILKQEITEHHARHDHRITVGDAIITLAFDPYLQVYTLHVQYETGGLDSIALSFRQSYVPERWVTKWLRIGDRVDPVEAFSYEKVLSENVRSELMNAFATLFSMVDSGLTKRARSI